MQIAGPGIDHVCPGAVNAIEKSAFINELPACLVVHLICGLLRKDVFRIIGKAHFHLKGLAPLLGLQINANLVDRVVIFTGNVLYGMARNSGALLKGVKKKIS